MTITKIIFILGIAVRVLIVIDNIRRIRVVRQLPDDKK